MKKNLYYVEQSMKKMPEKMGVACPSYVDLYEK